MSFLSQNLLPGILYDVTLAHIATKLPWTAFNILSSVSRAWHQAIESREVHGERIRCGSTETLVVIKHLDDNNPSSHRNAISLYSMRERTIYQLPPIPHLPLKSRFSKLVSADGRLYVFGPQAQCKCSSCSKSIKPTREESACSGNMNIQIYMLDLAGTRQWKKCTSIEQPEQGYKASIISSFIVRDHIFLQGGSADWFNSSWNVFNSAEDDWRAGTFGWTVPEEEPSHVLGLIPIIVTDSWFIVQQKKYRMTEVRDGSGRVDDIFEYDVGTKSWIHQHSISSNEIALDMTAALGPCTCLIINPSSILPLNNELLALAFWVRYAPTPEPEEVNYGKFLLQSSGFGTKRKDIVWRKISDSFSFDLDTAVAMCPLQL